MPNSYRVATDIGGTFTDLVAYEQRENEEGVTRILTTKVDTTPGRFEKGVLNSFDKASVPIGQIDDFLAHGTTVVINAITERKGVKTGLITTRGFRDVLEIARGDRLDFFNIRYKKPPPFIPRYLRAEITERTTYKGDIATPIDLAELDEILQNFEKEGVEAIAICLLHAYANPRHEQVLVEEINRRMPETCVVASHHFLREWREYERTNTTALSAYVQPIVTEYVNRLEKVLKDEGFGGSAYIMQSNGGIDTFDSARSTAVTMVESGPASGMLGAAVLGELIGERNIIALDVGGTTAKCSLIYEGKVQVITEYHLERSQKSSGYPLLVPVVDIVEIGNGGGSIASVDMHGKLHVGPKSAGADPGPVAYGRGGTEPTTTDAHLLTGRIGLHSFHGGRSQPSYDDVHAAFGKLGDSLGIDPVEAALGVIRVANSNMSNALRLVSISRGYDPRDFILVAFGGGGGLHAMELAADLKIPKVVIPAHASVFSAWGMLMSDLRRDSVLTRPIVVTKDAMQVIGKSFSDIEREAKQSFAKDGYSKLRFERRAEMRYVGQEHTTKVLLPDGPLDQSMWEETLEIFHKAYESEYSYRLENPVELVTYHLAAFASVERPELPKIGAHHGDTASAKHDSRQVVTGSAAQVASQEFPVYEREQLGAGCEIVGPAILEEHGSSTTVIFPGDRLRVDEYGNLHVNVANKAS